MRKAGFILVGLVMTCAATTAVAEIGPRPYFGVQGGYTDLQSANNGNGDYKLRSTYKEGYNVSAYLGYRYVSHFRTELELSYRKNKLDSLQEGSGFGPFSGNELTSAQGNETATSLMANVYYDFPTLLVVQPYIGGGAGAARVALNDVSAQGVDIANDQSDVFAYQAMAGLNLKLTDRASLYAEYRYFATRDPSFETKNGTHFDSQYKTNNAEVGVRVNF